MFLDKQGCGRVDHKTFGRRASDLIKQLKKLEHRVVVANGDFLVDRTRGANEKAGSKNPPYVRTPREQPSS